MGKSGGSSAYVAGSSTTDAATLVVHKGYGDVTITPFFVLGIPIVTEEASNVGATPTTINTTYELHSQSRHFSVRHTSNAGRV